MQDLPQYWLFLWGYVTSRILSAGHAFEQVKDVIVAFLIVKRGRYSSSFLNTSFLLIVAATFIAGPIIIDNSPFAKNVDEKTYSAAVVSYNPYESALETVISTKPRSSMENYSVRGGDTLESISKKFDISVDTIKWANNMDGDVIKPGQELKIPPVTGVVHKVAAGDTVYSVAKKYGTDAQAIVNFPFNDFADLDTFALSTGQTLYVPGGAIKPAPAPAGGYFIAQIQAGVKGSSNFIWPSSGIITTYPVWYHMALDIASPASPPVLAADTGTVIYAGCISSGYGCHVIIDHANGYQTLYAHLSSYIPDAGAVVNQGQQIGVMGSTGRSTGTHLHFEIRSGGTLLNPLNFLK
ncbi:MAG: peptidoglycan DD-metalloendopeptidase family protein [Patescibacteria group bacterium]